MDFAFGKEGDIDFSLETTDLVVERPKFFTVDWTVGFGGSIAAGVTLHNDRVFFASADNYLYCVNAGDGAMVWRFKARDVTDTSRPVVDDGVVYVGFFDGYVYAVDEGKGSFLWEFKTGDKITGSPTVDGDRVYFGSFDGYVYALNKKDGRMIWKFKTGDSVGATPDIVGDKILIGSFDGNLYCLSSEGQEIWRFKTGGAILNYYRSPINNGVIHFGSWNGVLYAVDIETGKERWRFQAGKSIETTPVIENDRIYLGSWDRNFYCLSLDGKEIWRFRANDTIGDQRPLIHENIIFFGSCDSGFYALDKITGKLVWSFKTSGNIWSGAVYYRGSVIFGSYDCHLYSLDAKTGKENWRFQTSIKTQSPCEIVTKIIKKPELKTQELNIGIDEKFYSSDRHEAKIEGDYGIRSEYSTTSEYKQKSEYDVDFVILEEVLTTNPDTIQNNFLKFERRV
jgi:outer membrane protein assembly factor BamB